jgi:hypothetical protein
VTSGDAWEFWGKAAGGDAHEGGPFARAGRGIATLLLAGLTSMEVMALAVASVAVVGFLWLADAVAPDRLVTDASIRGTWAVMVLAVIRPITWAPYVLLFLGFQAMADALAPGWSVVVRNLAANLGALAALAGGAWLVFAAIPGSSTDALSFLGFLTGAVPPEDLGRVAGEWDTVRAAAVVAGALLVRIVLPPLRRDLDLSGEPVLGFVSGARGRVDRVVLVAVVIASVALVGIGLALRASR